MFLVLVPGIKAITSLSLPTDRPAAPGPHRHTRSPGARRAFVVRLAGDPTHPPSRRRVEGGKLLTLDQHPERLVFRAEGDRVPGRRNRCPTATVGI